MFLCTGTGGNLSEPEGLVGREGKAQHKKQKKSSSLLLANASVNSCMFLQILEQRTETPPPLSFICPSGLKMQLVMPVMEMSVLRWRLKSWTTTTTCLCSLMAYVRLFIRTSSSPARESMTCWSTEAPRSSLSFPSSSSPSRVGLGVCLLS